MNRDETPGEDSEQTDYSHNGELVMLTSNAIASSLRVLTGCDTDECTRIALGAIMEAAQYALAECREPDEATLEDLAPEGVA